MVLGDEDQFATAFPHRARREFQRRTLTLVDHDVYLRKLLASRRELEKVRRANGDDFERWRPALGPQGRETALQVLQPRHADDGYGHRREGKLCVAHTARLSEQACRRASAQP